MKILVSGFPYVRQSYFDVFNYYPQKEDKLSFLLPKVWKVKNGKVIFRSPKDERVIPTNAYFHHSNYPAIGGLLKGWMPLFPVVALKLKIMQGLDLVYSCSEPILLTTLYQALWTKLFGTKHVVFSWENVDYNKKFKGFNGLIKNIILKLNLFFCDGVICGNQKSAAIFSGLTDKPISVIPLSGVDGNFYVPENIKTFKGKSFEGKLIYLFSGAMSYRKGIHIILEAFKATLKDIPNGHLVLVGSGEYEQEIDNLIKDLDLEYHITRLPWVDREELRGLFAVSDIFLYPSISYKGWEEQFGYSMAEASLMEKPVISTESGSIDELIINGVSGILISPDNVIELKKAMLKLGQDAELRWKMGREARRHILQNFSHDIVAAKFYEFFHRFSSNPSE